MTSGTGTCTVTANQAGDGVNYAAAPQQTATVNAALASQSITLTVPTGPVVYGTTFPVSASASPSNLPVTLAGSGACSGSGTSTATFTMTSGTGTCTVTANQLGNNNYGSAPQQTGTVTATQASQSITVNIPAPATATDKSSFTIVATASSGLPVSFSSSGAACTHIGARFTIDLTTGTCTETMSQGGNANYLAATPVIETTTVVPPIAPTVNFTGAPASAHYQDTFTVVATTNASSIPTITATGACTIDDTTLIVTMTSGTGTCTLTAKWAADNVYKAASAIQRTTAEKLTSIITWPTPDAITYGTPLGPLQQDATASVDGSFAYSPVAGKVLPAGSQTLKVTFTPTAVKDYTKGTATVELTVDPVGTTTTITSTTPNPSTVGKTVTVVYTVQAVTNATKPTGNVTVNASTGETCTGGLAGGNGSCKLTFTSAGPRTLTATYASNSNNWDTSVSAAFTQTVN
jgi:hypothetical protein